MHFNLSTFPYIQVQGRIYKLTKKGHQKSTLKVAFSSSGKTSKRPNFISLILQEDVFLNWSSCWSFFLLHFCVFCTWLTVVIVFKNFITCWLTMTPGESGPSTVSTCDHKADEPTDHLPRKILRCIQSKLNFMCKVYQ